MRELDVVLETYLACDYHFPDARSVTIFENFLESTDMDLYEWLTKRSRPSNSEFATIVDRALAMQQ
jgi:succinate dehydrogenase flavin-adding protein (antitoxin of CptAB toxin-antitoxin module)